MSNTAISTRFLTSDKSRGAPARLQYSQVTPHTGTSAVPGQTIRIKLPSNRVGTYLDADYSFLQMTCVFAGLSGDPTVKKKLNLGGIGGFFKQIVLRNAGSHLSDINEYAIWRALHTVQSVDNDFLSKDGGLIMGTNTVAEGRALTNAQEVVLCDFLPNLASLFQTSKYIPLFSNDSLELDLVLGDLQSYFIETLGSTPSCTFKDIKLNLAVVEVAPEVDREIISAHQGVFKYLLHNTGHYVSTIGGSSAHTFNVGCSYSSLNRLDFAIVVPGVTTKHLFRKHQLKKKCFRGGHF